MMWPFTRKHDTPPPPFIPEEPPLWPKHHGCETYTNYPELAERAVRIVAANKVSHPRAIELIVDLVENAGVDRARLLCLDDDVPF
jgi:hypothetical protein